MSFYFQMYTFDDVISNIILHTLNLLWLQLHWKQAKSYDK